MKIFITVLFILFTSMVMNSQVFRADDLQGEWHIEENISKGKIIKKGDQYFGNLTWAKDALDKNGKPKLDKNNPNPELAKKPILGIQLISNFEYEGNGKWVNGKIYDPRSGKTYDCVITMKNINTIHVRGFVGFSLLGRTMIWKRVIDK
jgi:uncharacterized protein (DUF2147 family)